MLYFRVIDSDLFTEEVQEGGNLLESLLNTSVTSPLPVECVTAPSRARGRIGVPRIDSLLTSQCLLLYDEAIYSESSYVMRKPRKWLP